MSDIPAGEWSALLVGHQWPGSASLAALGDAARRRAAIAASQTEYAGNLRVTRTVTLANQQGVTAERIHAAFESGEQAAANVSDANATKQNAYGSALRHAGELRDALTEIANHGNSEIQAILSSQRALPDKLSAIVTTVVAAQTHANAKAAECSANLFETIQSVCATGTPTLSARQFASANGVDPARAFRSPDADAISSQVAQTLRGHPTGATGLVGSPVNPSAATEEQTQAPLNADSTMVPTGSPQVGSVGSVGSAVSATASSPAIGAIGDIRQDSPTDARVAGRRDFPVDTGGRDNTPISIGTEAITTTARDMFSHRDPQRDLTPSDSPIPEVERASTGSAPDVAPPHDAAAAHVVVNLATAAQLPPGFAPSAINPAAPTPTPVQAPMPQGPLLAYGADLKPTAAAPPAAPTMIPAAPTSAPFGSAGGTGPGSQPAVALRQQSSVNAAVAGLAERAFAAASTATAAAKDCSTAEIRLRRIVNSIARQQPELRWAVGDLVDGSTVLVTDLAGGWIPPHIDIPVGVSLIEPGLCHNNLAALIGEATLAATHEPGQPLGPDSEQVQISVRSRGAPAVDDLGWELSQATKWRDGLPRLAHTLARAATAGTGYLDTEVQVLREHLRAVAQSVVGRYPARVDVAEVGNWQLLATIDALVNGDNNSANYHFAWFMAQSPQLDGRR